MKRHFDHDMTMDAIMRRWPGTIRVILGNGMLCVGCPIAPFHTVADAVREHALDEQTLVDELSRAME
ncbi:DUF1858 domain-containing protein [Aquamicrobium terrae]|uniref:Hybrid cluster-associated redox disulfide protein n=1 Tax=Aquamicrobium terrae TaxID=1324945 RepID=A0ABV2N3W7_9HYPH